MTGSVPPDENTTQDENYRSSDNKSSDNGQEMNSVKKKSSLEVRDCSSYLIANLFVVLE